MDTTSIINYLDDTYFKKYQLNVTEIILENQNSKYAGARFSLGGYAIRFRKANTTPNKTGQFLALWDKDTEGNNEALDYYNSPDLLMIFSQTPQNQGLFIFPKDLALEKGILSTTQKEGKLGFRVYAPWDEVSSPQARQSQAWQCKHFVDLNSEKAEERLKHLLKQQID